jgi:hypothetical protein
MNKKIKMMLVLGSFLITINSVAAETPEARIENGQVLLDIGGNFEMFVVEQSQQEPRLDDLLGRVVFDCQSYAIDLTPDPTDYNPYFLLVSLIRDIFIFMQDQGYFDQEEAIVTAAETAEWEAWVANPIGAEPGLHPRPLFELREALDPYTRQLIHFARQ